MDRQRRNGSSAADSGPDADPGTAYTAEVVDAYPITPRVRGLRLRLLDGTADYEPGQHTTVRFDAGGQRVVRSYTPTNLPGGDELTLAVKRYEDGLASSYLHARSPGDRVELGEFQGSLTLRDPDRDVALLASGTGITPMVALLRQYLREGTGRVHVVFGERDEESIMLRETLNGLVAGREDARLTVTLSDPGWEWTRRVGYVQDHLEDLFPDPVEWDFYVCGVPQMVLDTKERLRTLGADPDHVYNEGWEDRMIIRE